MAGMSSCIYACQKLLVTSHYNTAERKNLTEVSLAGGLVEIIL